MSIRISTSVRICKYRPRFIEHCSNRDIVKSYTSRTAYPFCASTMTQWHYRIALDQPTLIEILGASGAYSQSWNYARAGYPQHIVEKIGRDALSLKVQAMHSLRTLLNDDRRSTWESTVPIIAQLLFIEVTYDKRETRPKS
ncbi:hypothetical protein N7468_008907 [Penicillium chermesinum]|uniref:Uncharacterized protein n=1 Tax=Penicillium chermesinum TaxID=63820 RepID=A0A9W9NH80_9EURO|nr:uncharacterized protein N7468_008907 [Penicillium chermesinum]KAJ5219703.1 hypothetical protein N7468_008907 [Penicillium chermesinum]